jgi:hypothetical protein
MAFQQTVTRLGDALSRIEQLLNEVQALRNHIIHSSPIPTNTGHFTLHFNRPYLPYNDTGAPTNSSPPLQPQSATHRPAHLKEAPADPRSSCVPLLTAFESCKMAWLLGDWSRLTALDEASIARSDDRANIALLIATAHMQCGDFSRAMYYWRLSLYEWHCSHTFATQILAASTHISLEAAQRVGLNPRRADHHRSAVSTVLLQHCNSPVDASHQPSVLYNEKTTLLNTRQLHSSKSISFCTLNLKTSPLQIIVLGMHRSGTSCLTGLISLMGAYCGPSSSLVQPNHENAQGFYERREMRSITDALLRAGNAEWDDVNNFEYSNIPSGILIKQRDRFAHLLADLNQHNCWVLKEPRLALLLPLFLPQLDSPFILHIVRNPLDVARSLFKRNGLSIANGLALWFRYNIYILRATVSLPVLRISYDGLLADPLRCAHRILQFLPAFALNHLNVPAPEALYKFADASLYHQRSGLSKKFPVLSQDQEALFRLLRESLSF